MNTQALQSAASHLETLYSTDDVAAPCSFAAALGRTALACGGAGALALLALGAPGPDLSTPGAWLRIAATLAIAFGGVCGVAWLTGHGSED